MSLPSHLPCIPHRESQSMPSCSPVGECKSSQYSKALLCADAALNTSHKLIHLIFTTFWNKNTTVCLPFIVEERDQNVSSLMTGILLSLYISISPGSKIEAGPPIQRSNRSLTPELSSIIGHLHIVEPAHDCSPLPPKFFMHSFPSGTS